MRTPITNLVSLLPLLASLALSLLATSCGSGGVTAQEMILVELQFLDRSLAPTAPTGTQSLPRNATIGLVFSELVDPGSVNNQTIQLRYGPSFASVPVGSFQVNGNTVFFDPTVSSDGQPHPTGLEPVTQYSLSVPGIGEQQSVIRNLDSDSNLTTFLTQFTTSGGWLRELTPPQIEAISWAPDVDDLTGNIPGNGLLGIRFSEAMDPRTFVSGPVGEGAIDIRYTDAAVNASKGVALVAVAGSFTPSPDYQTFWFRPLFSWGDAKLIFTVEAFQDLTDLSGNLLVNPSSFGPYICDGNGIATGKVIQETFDNQDDSDASATNADWGSTESGTLLGQPVTSRNVNIYSYVEADNGGDSGRGQYAALADPLMGASFNAIVPNPVPPTNAGRRVMWAFAALKMGAAGAITAAAWGPDSNATFAAYYPQLKLRAGYQKQDQLTLSPSFSGNYSGSPAILYSGSYSVQQRKDVGNPAGEPLIPYKGTPTFGAACAGNPSSVNAGWNAPLFDWTGWYAWPDLTTYFEWDPQGDPTTSKRVFLFDVSVQEGDQFQQMRGWYGATYPCSGFLIGGLPLSRLRATYEEDGPNPQTDLTLGIQNPEATMSDTSFTLTRRTSMAQSRFYGQAGTDDTTFGPETDYRPALLTPSVQSNGAQVVIEYQAAALVDTDSAGNQSVNMAGAFTQDADGNPGWVSDINLCDGLGNIRYRIRLISNLINAEVGRVTKVIIPMVKLP